MRRALGHLLVVFALGCAGRAAPSSARSVRPRGVALARARCAIAGVELRCGTLRRALSELGLALPLRASAPRRLGGLWLLDADGVLVRVDAAGRVTGRAAQAGELLLTSAEFVCTGGAASMHCLVDHHDDAGCAAETTWTARAIDLAFSPARALAGGVLCGATAGGAQGCARLTRPCELGCLRYPACSAALRCIVGCAPEQAAIAAQPVEPAQFAGTLSSFPAAAVTHAHGRPQGGYAAGRARR